MFHITPDEIPLPPFLDPVLEYLADALPEPIYSALFTSLANFIALFSGLLSIVTTLVQSNFSDWNAQAILPPLITVLVAYLAIVNVYNTTRWFFRTTIFFLKWGAILSMLVGGASWLMATRGQEIATQGIISVIGSTLWDVINGEDQKPTERKGRRTQTQYQQRKPKVWESFDRHRKWDSQDDPEGSSTKSEGAKIMKDIAGFAARLLGENGWLDAAKSVVEDATAAAEADRKGQPPKGKKTPKKQTKGSTKSR